VAGDVGGVGEIDGADPKKFLHEIFIDRIVLTCRCSR
jgi:hypothetical protein